MALDGVVIVAVLAAALLHASWNAIVKGGSDPLLNMTTVTATSGLAALMVLPWLPWPGAAAWPYLALSIVLHFFYQLSLVRGYSLGDLSQVYPVARGVAPLGVAGLAVLAGEVPTWIQTAGLVLAASAIASLAFVNRPLGATASALPSALVAACFISAYTVVDGLGVRAADDGFSYIAWILFLDSFPMVIWGVLRRRGRVLPFLRSHGLRAAGGGLMAGLGYAVVLWAMERGAMAPIAALRETSVIFAAFLGTRLLGEPFGAWRLAAATALAIGLALVQTQGS